MLDETAGESAKAIYESFFTNNFTWDGKWEEAHQVVAFNIPMTNFYTGRQLWGDLQSTPHSALLAMLGWMVTRPDLGTDYKVDGTPQRYYCSPGRPRAVQAVEPLLAQADRAVIGLRVWVAILDPQLDIRSGIRKLINNNCAAAEERDQLMERMRAGNTSASARKGIAHELAYSRASGAVSGGLTSGPHRRIMSDQSLVNIMSLYLGRQEMVAPSSLDTLYSTGVLVAGSAFDPLVVLGADTAFSSNLDGVWKEQCTAANYINVGEGEDLSAFRGVFPPGVEAYRIISQYIDPDMLCGIPLPSVLKEHIGPIYEEYLTESSVVAELYRKIDQAEGNGNAKQVEYLTEDVMVARAGQARLIDEMDSKHESLRRASPCASLGQGLSGDSFDAAAVDAELIKRNALRKMYAPCKERYASIRRMFEDAEAKYAECEAERMDAADKAVAAADAAPEDRVLEAAAKAAVENVRDGIARIDGMTFEDTIQKVRGEMLDQFWRVYISATQVTATINSSRLWFAGLRHEKGKGAHWSQHFGLTENLSPFGDMIVRMTTEYGDALAVETNFRLMHLTQLVVMGAAQYKFDLRPNLIVTGEGGGGKSFMVEQAEFISIPGAMMKLTHLTKHGMNGGQDVSDTCIVMEELPLDMIGVDKYGNTTAADPYLKSRMTSAKSTTMQQDRSSDEAAGERRSRMYTSRAMCSHIFISNDILPAVNTAIMQRFISYVMRRFERADTNGQDRTFSTGSAHTFVKDAVAEVLHGAQLQHMYLFIWEKAIEAGVLPDIDMSSAQITCNWIFDELANRKVPKPSRRHKRMLLDIVRILTMYYGVDMEFLSEYAHAQRAISTGLMPDGARPAEPVGAMPSESSARRRAAWIEAKKAVDEYDAKVRAAFVAGSSGEFRPHMLEGLVKWSVATEEIVVYAISLLEFLWVPNTRVDVARAAAGLAMVSVDGTGTWVPTKKTKFRREEAETAFTIGANRPDTPAAAGGASDAPAAAGGAPARVGRHGASSSSSSPAHELPSQSAGGSAVNVLHGELKLDYRYIELVGLSTKDIAARLATQMHDPPSVNDIMGSINAMANDFIKCKRQKWVVRRRRTDIILDPDAGTYVEEEYDALEPDDDTTDDLIPCAIVDTMSDKIGTFANRRRVCIAVAVLDLKFSAVLREAIKEALSHDSQVTRDLITAFPYQDVVRLDSVLANGEPATEVRTYHQVFDTVKVERRPGVHRYVLNAYGRTKTEINALLSRKYGSVTAAQRADIDAAEAHIYVVRDNIDKLTLQKYWGDHGVTIEGVGPAYAPAAHLHIKYVRDTYASVLPKTLRVPNYPQDWVAMYSKRSTEYKKWAAINVDKTVAAQMQVDNLPHYGQNTGITSHARRTAERMAVLVGGSRKRRTDADADADADAYSYADADAGSEIDPAMQFKNFLAARSLHKRSRFS